MNRLQFSLARMMLGVAQSALACAAARFTWSFARWLLLPSLAVLELAAWATLLLWGQKRVTLAGFTLGGAVGWLLEMLALMLAEGGQGTYLPFLVFFGPFFLLSVIADSATVSTILFAIAPVLYSIYGAAVAGSARSHWGPACFAAILMFHYGLVGVALCFVIGKDFYDSRLSFSDFPWIIAATVLFGGIHIATLLFLATEWRRKRRRERRPS